MFNKDRNNDAALLDDELDIFLDQISQPLNFDYPPKFEWLLSDWKSTEWYLIGKDGTTRQDENGNWINAIKINWCQLLPNGKYLTDPEYLYILEITRRLIASMRTGSNATTERSLTQYTTTLYLFSLIRWMILQGYDKTPYKTLTYSTLTSTDFDVFCEQLEYGMPSVESFNQRIEKYLDSLSANQIKKHRDKNGLINRNMLGKAINIVPDRLYIPIVNVFLRKYETCDKYSEFNIDSREKNREYIGHRNEQILSLAQKYASETVVKQFLSIWSLLQKHSKNLDGLLNFNLPIDTSFSNILSSINYSPKGRTPTIPTHTALFYLDAAIKWVVEYGKPLLDFRNTLNKNLIEIRGTGTSRNDHYAPIAFKNTPIPTELTTLNFKRFNRNASGKSNKDKRENLSVDEAMECLLAACFIIITTFSTRRRGEILDLTVDCINDDYDGFVLDLGLQKASAHYILDHVQRPIPALVMVAVELLKEMNKDAREETKDEILKNHLFTQFKSKGISKLQNDDIIKRLDLFADVIEVPIFENNNEVGIKRRWYIRPHECRRFFAITYYWNSDLSSLQALSWFMGHLTIEETERYIEESSTADEIPENLAQLTIEALNSNETKGDKEKLKEITFKHFNVNNLDFIEEEHLSLFIQELHATGTLSIEIISAPDSKYGSNICLHISEK